MSDHTLAIVKTLATLLIAVVLIVAMTWIVISPVTTDETAKAALVVVSGGLGFVFGRETK